MSNDLPHNPNRVSFDPKDADIPEFDAIADERDMSRAELLRELVREEIGQDEDDDTHLPENDTLRRAYLQLLDSVDDTYRISTQAATSVLAQELQRPGESTKAILKRLESRGYVKPRWGTITVRRRDALPAAAGADEVAADG